MIRNIIGEVRQELTERVDNEYKQGALKYFKEEIKIIGIRTPDVRKIARLYFPIISGCTKEEIFLFCEELLNGEYFEEKTVAFEWAFRMKEDYKKSDFARFKKWLSNYVDNWAHCDDLCTHMIGVMLEMYPEYIEEVVQKWSRSKNRWMRRGAAVSLIYLTRRGKCLKEVFEIGEILMKDEDILVRKGLGWLLRETSDRYPSDVYRFLDLNKYRLSRLTLRYAVEKMLKGQKQALLKKEAVMVK